VLYFCRRAIESIMCVLRGRAVVVFLGRLLIRSTCSIRGAVMWGGQFISDFRLLVSFCQWPAHCITTPEVRAVADQPAPYQKLDSLLEFDFNLALDGLRVKRCTCYHGSYIALFDSLVILWLTLFLRTQPSFMFTWGRKQNQFPKRCVLFRILNDGQSPEIQ
jgi:hypothetical protein